MTWRILVVDDEPQMLELCTELLGGIGAARVVGEGRAADAAALLANERWDLLVTDLRMPELDGAELAQIARRNDPRLPVLVLTAYPTVETAVQSMKAGAAEYLAKPFEPEALVEVARRLLAVHGEEPAGEKVRRHVERGPGFGEMLGRSPAMQRVFDLVEQIAGTEVDVLITGETGTGKELVARSLHERSTRGASRFVPVDCGAIPEDLLESEFFGHERGAFTGAHSRSLGLLEFAHRGTFFMDEVGELPLKLQAKLLRALQERRIRRVGGTNETDVDVRVLAATSLDLAEEVRANRFRMDLFYRINVAAIRLPPLRERVEDIPLLAAHFTARYAREMGREGIELDGSALDCMCRYAWPGNVRELQNVVKRSIAMSCRDRIRDRDLPEPLSAPTSAGSGGAANGFFGLRDHYIACFEREYLQRSLLECGGNISQAAVRAEVPRGTFYRLLGRHGLAPAEYRE
jgi:DNA-binding NtrC family response regulator